MKENGSALVETSGVKFIPNSYQVVQKKNRFLSVQLVEMSGVKFISNSYQVVQKNHFLSVMI